MCGYVQQYLLLGASTRDGKLCACSYLVVRYAAGDKVAQTVGFYYMANAGGRLVGECHLSSALCDQQSPLR